MPRAHERHPSVSSRRFPSRLSWMSLGTRTMTCGIPAPLLLTFLATLLFPMLVAPSNAVNAAVAIGWPIPDDARPGQVLFVYDGDTIDVRLAGERVRLRYI